MDSPISKRIFPRVISDRSDQLITETTTASFGLLFASLASSTVALWAFGDKVSAIGRRNTALWLSSAVVLYFLSASFLMVQVFQDLTEYEIGSFPLFPAFDLGIVFFAAASIALFVVQSLLMSTGESFLSLGIRFALLTFLISVLTLCGDSFYNHFARPTSPNWISLGSSEVGVIGALAGLLVFWKMYPTIQRKWKGRFLREAPRKESDDERLARIVALAVDKAFDEQRKRDCEAGGK